MVNVDMDTEWLDVLGKDFYDWGEAYRDNLTAVLGWAAEIIRGWLEDYTPRRTGETATSWRVIAFDRNEYEITNTNEPIISFITEGTRPHDIYGSPLHWTDDSGEHFATHVRHPGTEPVDIVGQAMDAAEPELDELFDAVEDAADRAGDFD